MRLEPADHGHGGVLVGEVDRFLVPLKSPFTRYFVDVLYVAHNLRQRVQHLAYSMIPPQIASHLLFERRWRLAPAPGAGSEQGRVPRHLRRAVEMASKTFTGHGEVFSSVAEQPWRSWILCSDYPQSRHDRAVAFLFTSCNRRPAAVLKLRDVGAPGSSLREEWAALRNLSSRLCGPLKMSVPEPLGFQVFGGVEALLLSVLPGRSAYVEMQRTLRPQQCVARHFEAAGSWLGCFHTATSAERMPFFLGLDEAVAALLCEIGGGATPSWRRVLEGYCRDKPITAVAGHGDFWPRNLLLPEGTVSLPGVVDWEHFSDVAPLYRDLFDFPLTYGLNFGWSLASACRRRSPAEVFRLTFVENNTLSRAVRRYLRRYCSHMQLDPGVLGPLFCLYLLDQAAGVRGGGAVGLSPTEEKRFWLQCYETARNNDLFAFSG